MKSKITEMAQMIKGAKKLIKKLRSQSMTNSEVEKGVKVHFPSLSELTIKNLIY